ncbi:RNA polymerase sigma factor [Flagellimonas allohymeniacidonis]|uniref:RNA polymerase sigma factor n=1 Tax=Flagellimonas allohymeniacidonis TaxID=2517819 RepID=A0A4Q8QDA3_9FLAO|nr:sigma-70 family RNA polymerase sigma factor [Allomuricauda hymeniacidonis]TAI48351.1 sigma-70 family RNA polymerase sigma factor [Allomuricauda hymeniacidonis]
MKNQEKINSLIEHFFRHESGKMISVLTRYFGAEKLNLAEDLVQETIIAAISTWTYRGIPDNPNAWLYRVAKNKALNILKREKIKQAYISSKHHRPIPREEILVDEIFSPKNIEDDQLRMMFLCCNPLLSIDSQIALTLKTLCGFSISEIAKAFFTSPESVNKRLVRARKKIRDDNISFDVPSKMDINERLETVLETIYLIFNEGYSASKGKSIIRRELCEEAIRLTDILLNTDFVAEKANVYALKALMQLNTSRFNARQDANGQIVRLEDQDRRLWDLNIMEKGFVNLGKSHHKYVSKYHLMASVSAYYCMAKDFESTNWKSVLTLYDKLLQIENSPIVLMNRAIIISKVHSIEKGIEELENIKNHKAIRSHHLYYSIFGEFLFKLKRNKQAVAMMEKAIELAPLKIEKETLKKRLENFNFKN